MRNAVRSALVAWPLAIAMSPVFAGDDIDGIQLTPNPARVGQPVTITVSGDNRPSLYCGLMIGFGDGIDERTVVGQNVPFPKTVTHSYTTPGTYTVLAEGRQVKGRFGCIGKVKVALVVKATPEAAPPKVSGPAPSGDESLRTASGTAGKKSEDAGKPVPPPRADATAAKPLLPPFPGFLADVPAEQAKLRDARFPWPDTDATAQPLPVEKATAHRGATRHAMRNARLLYGNLTPQQSKDFDNIWAALFDHPTADSLAFMQAANPLLDEVVDAAGEEEAMIGAYRDSLVSVALGAGASSPQATQNALDMAAGLDAELREKQQRMQAAAEALKKLPPLPNPLAAKAAAQGLHDGVMKSGGKAGKDIAGMQRRGAIRIELDHDGPLLANVPMNVRAVVPADIARNAAEYRWRTAWHNDDHTTTKPESVVYFPFNGDAQVHVTVKDRNGKEIADGALYGIPIQREYFRFPGSQGKWPNGSDKLEIEEFEHDDGNRVRFEYKLKFVLIPDYPNGTNASNAQQALDVFNAELKTARNNVVLGETAGDVQGRPFRNVYRLRPMPTLGRYVVANGEELLERENIASGYTTTGWGMSQTLEGTGYLRMSTGGSYFSRVLKLGYEARVACYIDEKSCAGRVRAKYAELKKLVDGALTGLHIEGAEGKSAVASKEIAKMDAATRAEAISHHEAIAALREDSASRWEAEARGERNAKRRQELLDNAEYDRDMAQGERDIVTSLKTGTLVHTRTAWDDRQHERLVSRIRDELADFEKDKQRLALLTKLGALVDGEEGERVRRDLQTQTIKAIRAPDRGAQLDRLLGSMRRVVISQRQATAAKAQADEAQAQMYLSTAEGVKAGADAAIWASAFLVPGVGSVSVAYGIGTGYGEGGIGKAAENAVRSYSNYLDVAAAALHGGLDVSPDTGQRGGFTGALWEGSKTAIVNHMMGWATSHTTSFVQNAVNKAALPPRPEAFKDNHQRYREALAQARTPEQRQAVEKAYRVIGDRESMKRELQQTTQRLEAEVRKLAGRPDGSVDTAHPQYGEIRSKWLAEMQAVRDKYQGRETRMAEHAKMLAAANLRADDMPLSGGEPKSIMSDMDLSPRSLAAAQAYIGTVKKSGRQVIEYADRWIVPDGDTTIWKPGHGGDKAGDRSFEERVVLDSLPGSDKFPTTGGVEYTTQGGITYDPRGAVIANAKKAVEAGIGGSNPDLHVIGKSLDKSIEISGVDVDPALVGRLRAVRNHASADEAGITTFGASAQKKAQELTQFLNRSREVLGTTYQAASETSNKFTATLNQQLRAAKARGDTATAQEIELTLSRYRISNELALNTIAVQDKATVAGMVGREQPPEEAGSAGFARLTESLRQEREADEKPRPPKAANPQAFGDLAERSKQAAGILAERVRGAPAGSTEANYLKGLQKAFEAGATDPARAVTEVRLLSGYEMAWVLKQLGVTSSKR